MDKKDRKEETVEKGVQEDYLAIQASCNCKN